MRGPSHFATLRVSELVGLTKDHLDWQGHRLTLYGKGGPYGSRLKRRLIPLANRIQPLVEGHFALHDTLGVGVRRIQLRVKDVANRAHSPSGDAACTAAYV